MKEAIVFILSSWAIQGFCIWLLLRKAQEK
jgi:hypothetical protein